MNTLMRSGSAIILYKKNKVLLHLRDDKTTFLPNTWAFFGGAIEQEETPEQAIKRETKEELSYVLKKPKLVMTKKETANVTKYLFVEEYDKEQELKLGERADMGWFNKEEMQTLNLPLDHKKILEELYKQRIFV